MQLFIINLNLNIKCVCVSIATFVCCFFFVFLNIKKLVISEAKRKKYKGNMDLPNEQ